MKKLAPKGVYRYRRAKKYEKELNDEDSETETINNDDDLTELIISQDPIKGFWNKNDNTIKIEELLEKNIINNINNISLEYKEKVDEYLLVLNKAKNYLKQKGIIYEGIISKIEVK